MGGSCSSDNSDTCPKQEKTPSKRNSHSSTVKHQTTTREEPETTPAGQEETKASNHQTGSDSNPKPPIPATHYKCRNALYARTSDVSRCHVPDDKVSWDVDFPDYNPVEFVAVHEVALEADEDFRKVTREVKWNEEDGRVNRRSHHGTYQVVGGVSRNPVGRTGVCSRGGLAHWGPNHAADPIVTRWKRDESNQIVLHEASGKQVLQFIAIQRGDTGQWAIPGGFVDSGEEVYSALKREFCEEAMNCGEVTGEAWKEMEDNIRQLFENGTVVYEGYVDDPRNTDNSWMESVAVHFHDERGELVGNLHLHAGDDAVGVQWRDIDRTVQLYASHETFIRRVAEKADCHW